MSYYFNCPYEFWNDKRNYIMPSMPFESMIPKDEDIPSDEVVEVGNFSSNNINPYGNVINPYENMVNPFGNMMNSGDMLVNLDPYTYPQNLAEALELMKEAISDEREDELFYDYIISVAPNEEAKSIIGGIRDDEKKHNKMFKKLYYDFTGEMLSSHAQESFEKPASYCAAVIKALLGEVGAVQKYRKILFALQDRVQINMLTEIITDELRHASLYNLLYCSGQCFMK